MLANNNKRLIPLEAYRGIAAFAVLFHHFFLGFSPQTTGFMDQARDNDSLIGQPLFVFFNGISAVAFFFTLSGFVLCWSYFQHEDSRKLLLMVIKRLPRLAAITTVSTVLSYAAFKFGLVYFYEAGKLSGSPWLASFAKGWNPGFEADFLDAVKEGLLCFFTGKSIYNSSLWSMKPEFIGSMVVYATAGLISIVLAYRYRLLAFAILALAAMTYNQLVFPFICGVFLSAYLARSKQEIPLSAALFFVAIGLYLLGYLLPIKSYLWVQFLPLSFRGYFQTIIYTLGSAAIIFATMSNQQLFQKLNGKFFALLGKISFPVYLMNILVISSISSYVFLGLSAMQLSRAMVLSSTFLVTVVATVMIALPLAMLDDWWVRRLDAVSKKILLKMEK